MLPIRAVAVVAGLGAMTGMLSACKPSQASADPRTNDQLVEIAAVEPAETGALAFSGVVSARVQSNLGFRVSGKVIERLVDSGQFVRKGQPLLRLDRTDYAHAITAQGGSVDAARARLLQTAADEERYRNLVESGAVSRSAYDQAKAEADGARALLSAAEAQLEMARDEGEYSTLVADADGTVTDTTAEPGQFVSAGQVVIRVARAGPREAAINLPETLRPAIGSVASVSLYGQTGEAQRYPSRLRQLSDAADPLTRTFEARYVLEGAAAKAPLGATVTVRLSDSTSADGLAVPLGAVTDEGQGTGVWLIDHKASSVSYRSVHVVRLEGERAVVTGALNAGDTIVALGGHVLHEGQRVRLPQARVASR